MSELHSCQSDVRANCQCQQCRDGRELRKAVEAHERYMLSDKVHPRLYERLMQRDHRTPQRTQ